ncbi:hypothetical protein [Novosphingobium sp.]|uniref:hypothetical protein n=1 Tax=Novosphingobium sp. TaxID=1874826 RepID=UPI0025D2B75C|nr:hypothetical protein [Novosphingobium sp.]
MKSPTGRPRHAVLLAGLAALAPGLCAGAPSAFASETGTQHFNPPRSAVITRTLWRLLSDGQAIVVTRRYDVRFVRAQDGFRLEGSLIDTAVNAPPELAALAEIERSRADHAFPILLDRAGRIQTDGTLAAPVSPDTLTAHSLKVVEKSQVPVSGRQEILRQLAGLTAMPGHSPTPAELFDPHAANHRETRTLALPGGMLGEVELSTKVEAAAGARLPSRVEKVTTTRLAGTTNVSREVWTVTPR